jgi:hypothetical protein
MRVYEPDEEELMVLLGGLRARQRSGICTPAFWLWSGRHKFGSRFYLASAIRWVFMAGFLLLFFLFVALPELRQTGEEKKERVRSRSRLDWLAGEIVPDQGTYKIFERKSRRLQGFEPPSPA